jgi:signal transduction histidine kinase
MTRLRALLVLVLVAAWAAGAGVLLAAGLPLAGRGALGPASLVALAIAAATAGILAGALLLTRLVAAPVERLLRAAAGLRAGGLPVLGEEGDASLPRAALAFERVAAELSAERERLAAKVDELTRANGALAEARASLVRSEKLATVGRLAAGLAHEVGNPLGAVTGYAELARARVPPGADPELGDAIARIAAAAARIDRTLRDLLDFARPAAIALAPVDVGAVVDASLRLARVQPRFRAVEVEVGLAPGLPPALADEHHLAQVLVNLLLNAGDATAGAGHVRVDARAEDGALVLEVRDDGPGIAAADLPRLFDPFFTTKDPGDGTGLGLAIAHRIVEAFGGEIEASNAPGGGALFRLRLRAGA